MNSQFPVFKNTYILCPVKRPKSNDNQVAGTTPNAQIMVLNTISYKGIRALWRNGWFQVWGKKCIVQAWNTWSCQKARK